jgi:branched-chain amino acid transport system permease protein
VFALGSALAGLGGALETPRQPANLGMDLSALGDAFVVVVVGGMGSIPGAYVAALLISEIKAICIGLGTQTIAGIPFNFSKLTLVAEFIVMAIVLIARPYGLLGRAQGMPRHAAAIEDPLKPAGRALKIFSIVVLAALLSVPLLAKASPYTLVLGTDVLIAVLFAASLHFIMGPGGMHSFGHAAYFGLGCYGAGLLLKLAGFPMAGAIAAAPLAAALGAAIFGWFAVRLSGVYLAMLTLAFAQIVWAIVFQWETLTGGSNGVLGIWPTAPFNSAWVYYLLVLALTVAGVLAMRRILFSPFGYAMRAGRDSPLRAEATGIAVLRVHWIAFIIAGTVCGLAGALFAFAKGGISPETIHVSRSIDGLVMVLLGGIHELAGPLVGAPVFTLLQDSVMRQTPYWRGVLGVVILALVLLFPMGIAGTIAGWTKRFAR